MRGIGNHRPPTETQPEPTDLSWKEIKEQVTVFHLSGQHIHPEVAREISSRVQTLTTIGLPFIRFTNSGSVDDDLQYSTRYLLMNVDLADERNMYYALHAYVVAVIKKF